MAKAKKQLEAASPVSAPVELSEQQRAERVLNSQGRAIGLVGSLGAARVAKLASFTNEAGDVLPAAVEGVAEVITEFYTEQKAEVDPGAVTTE